MVMKTPSDLPVRLPRRPRLVFGIDAVQRSRTEVQVGLDPRLAVVIDELPPKVARTLCALDGTMRLSTLLDRAGPEHADLLCHAVSLLTARGLVEDAAGVRLSSRQPDVTLWSRHGTERADVVSARCAHGAVVVHGEGRLMVAIATLLAAAGVGQIVIESAGTVAEQDVGTGFLTTDVGLRRRNAAVEAVLRINPATCTSALPSGRNPDLVILADSVVPSPELVSRLMCDKIPHLAVRARDGIGIAGPLVLPGRTSCLHCADLHRAARDRKWPRVANQLAGRRQFADANTTQATAAFAVGQILRTLCDPMSESPLMNTTLEVDIFSGTTARRGWSPHPRCDCGAVLGRM